MASRYHTNIEVLVKHKIRKYFSELSLGMSDSTTTDDTANLRKMVAFVKSGYLSGIKDVSITDI